MILKHKDYHDKIIWNIGQAQYDADKNMREKGEGESSLEEKKVPANHLLNIWFAQNQDNMSEWRHRSICIMLFQWASTTKIQPDALLGT